MSFEKINKSAVFKSFIKCAKSGKLYGHYSTNPLGMLKLEEVVFSCWSDEYFDDVDESSYMTLALLSILRHQSFSTASSLHYVFDQCGSSIEKIFLASLICACNNKEIGLAVYSEGMQPFFKDLQVQGSSCLHIYPQWQIGNYCVDFLLTLVLDSYLTFIGDDDDITNISGKSQLIIECDGHDFHEKTKEQASRDKERDRALQGCGYDVFRFTGSDIYNDAFRCTLESLEHLFHQIIREATGKPSAQWLGCDNEGIDRAR